MKKNKGNFSYRYEITREHNNGYDYTIHGPVNLHGWRRGTKDKVVKYLMHMVHEINLRHRLTSGKIWERSKSS